MKTFNDAVNEKVLKMRSQHLKSVIGDVSVDRISKRTEVVLGAIKSVTFFVDNEPVVTYYNPEFKTEDNSLKINLTFKIYKNEHTI